MENKKFRQQKIIKISKKKLLITVVVIIVLGFIWHNNSNQYLYEPMDYPEVGIETTSVEAPRHDVVDSEGMMYEKDLYYPEPLPPYYDRDVDVTDTREFLKTTYGAHFYTKNVSDTVDKVETAIKSVGGRIDGLNSSDRHGYISFVIAKSNLSEFRDEIEKITHAKLYTESISSKNLLHEKVDIEDRTEDVVESLEDAEQAKRNLDQSHKDKIDYWTAQILALQEQLDDDLWYEEMGAAYSEDERSVIVDDERNKVMEQILALQQKQRVENVNYSHKNNNLVTQINNLGGNLEVLEEEDTDFMNDIETVEGHVQVELINCWEKWGRLSVTPMWLNVVIVVGIAWWILNRRKIVPKIELT